MEADAGAEAEEGLITQGFTNRGETPVKDEGLIDVNMGAKAKKKM